MDISKMADSEVVVNNALCFLSNKFGKKLVLNC